MNIDNIKPYHYTECGLDSIWLHGGVITKETPQGVRVSIKNIEGLHDAIGNFLVNHKINLTREEIKFLRIELGLSQAFLAKLLKVSEQTVHRWETGKTEINSTAEQVIRLLYKEYLREKHSTGTDNDNGFSIRKSLQRLANLDDELDQLRWNRIDFSNKGKNWNVVENAA